MNKDTQLVMENYEQKYNEALERAKEFMTNKGVAPNADSFKTAKELIGTIFPELRESEDERIRKIILSQIKQWNQEALKENCKIDFEVSTKCIAWLKKQSEQKTTPKFKIGDTIHKIGENTVFPRTIEKIEDGYYVCNNSHSFINIKFQDDYELVEKNPDWREKYIADVFEKVGLARIAREMRNDNLTNALQDAMIELSKQGEQKNADEVKPKFKIEKGKWYICIKDLLDNYANKAFQEGDIYLSTQNGNLIPSNSNVPYEIACPDTYFRDWTIQDSKDGDVLVDKIDEEPNDFIYIFKECDQNLGFWSHCYLDTYINKFHEGEHHNNYNVGVPATKEQRDLLFSKMKEAGYEWDAGKKELKKIEQEPYPETLEKAIELYYYSYGNEKNGFDNLSLEQFKDIIKTFIEDYGNKSTWSEEDEEEFQIAIDTLVKAGQHDSANWLKSIKERMKGK